MFRNVVTCALFKNLSPCPTTVKYLIPATFALAQLSTPVDFMKRIVSNVKCAIALPLLEGKLKDKGIVMVWLKLQLHVFYVCKMTCHLTL